MGVGVGAGVKHNLPSLFTTFPVGHVPTHPKVELNKNPEGHTDGATGATPGVLLTHPWRGSKVVPVGHIAGMRGLKVAPDGTHCWPTFVFPAGQGYEHIVAHNPESAGFLELPSGQRGLHSHSPFTRILISFAEQIGSTLTSFLS
jgi:hypothetical protein